MRTVIVIALGLAVFALQGCVGWSSGSPALKDYLREMKNTEGPIKPAVTKGTPMESVIERFGLPDMAVSHGAKLLLGWKFSSGGQLLGISGKLHYGHSLAVIIGDDGKVMLDAMPQKTSSWSNFLWPLTAVNLPAR